jgi:hypothetical protein
LPNSLRFKANIFCPNLQILELKVLTFRKCRGIISNEGCVLAPHAQLLFGGAGDYVICSVVLFCSWGEYIYDALII